MTWFDERLHIDWGGKGYAQRFEVQRVVARIQTEHQDLVIFETPYFGRVLALDGIIQTTERDEFVYHEMLAHVPILAHGEVGRVLIIGGGDGGVLREVLRHPGVERAVMVEIDDSVINLCAEHMPALSNHAFEDERTEVIIADGLAYVRDTDETFDLIIVDSTDPVGPGEVLFGEPFYRDCHRCLTNGGVLITQTGVPFFQPDEIKAAYGRLEGIFADVGFYLIVVPSYVGGYMALGWASDDASLRVVPRGVLEDRRKEAGIEGLYYSAEVHQAAFSLPPFIRNLLPG